MKEEKRKETQSESAKNDQSGFTAACFLLCTVIIMAGAFYLYQVNDLATKGYEIRDVQNQIADLSQKNKDMQIKEVELESMYNIEKATNNLDLINAQNVSYMEMDSSMAMR